MTLIRPVLLIILACAAANAGPQGQLRTACETADAVVLGRIDPLVLTSAPASFLLTVDGVITRTTPRNSVLTITWPGSLTAARMSPPKYRALWFLRNTPSGVPEISPVGGPRAPLFASGLALPPDNRSGRDQIPTGACHEAVCAVLRDSAAYIDQSPACLTAMETLLREDPPKTAAALQNFSESMQSFAQSASVNLRTLALASGIRRQDVQSLAQFAAQTSLLAKSQVIHPAAAAVAAWRDPDPAGLAALGTISQTAGAYTLSRSVAQALMMIHTKDTVPHLAKLLSSIDPELRGAAIRGLSFFVKEVPILSAENVRSMAYFAEVENPEYFDETISPYVSIIPVSPEKEAEHVKAWLEWWRRMATRFN